ncbi:roadblock/LC7 domain-containing protein [Nocardiopsis ansamitocini]|uniref:Dynein regulation protein LC7 n=1 Tax=Nocardiopsis ansamitocini TaxID=1670832 RepID=A0A9W6P7D4_9ACTN|nr:roadblock/LC7 domain-containing protein [Nocardiopsis ansamitocini]GLU48839.1 dynein regulation protein LC7 [Nocardiopsis ansamitocini]
MSQEAIVLELAGLRGRVMGVTDSVVSAADGLLVASDTDGVQPQSLAALAAAALGLGKRTSSEVGMGTLREVVTRCQGGYVVIYAVGVEALLVVMGDEGMDTATLRRESRRTVERIGEILEVTPAV